jgi:hypothetical protein
MVFLTRRKESRDSNTPSHSSSRTSANGALYRTTTIQSDRGSTSNSSVHTTSTAATSEDSFDYTKPSPRGVPSIIFDTKSFNPSLEKPTSFHFRNQSQSTVGTILREAGSVRGFTATPLSAQEIRLSNILSFEDEDNSANNLFLRALDRDRVRARQVLESKVARVASRSFSVEKVAALEEEVERWLAEFAAADSVRVLSPVFNSITDSSACNSPQHSS